MAPSSFRATLSGRRVPGERLECARSIVLARSLSSVGISREDWCEELARRVTVT